MVADAFYAFKALNKSRIPRKIVNVGYEMSSVAAIDKLKAQIKV